MTFFSLLFSFFRRGKGKQKRAVVWSGLQEGRAAESIIYDLEKLGIWHLEVQCQWSVYIYLLILWIPTKHMYCTYYYYYLFGWKKEVEKYILEEERK